jgi:hypothetical protein
MFILTYFKLIAGFDCGVDKSVCKSGYPENCVQCLSKKFNNSNFLLEIIDATEQYSEQKRKEMIYKHIWRKYQDILTIRHVIILTQGGVPAFNMAIGDIPIDVTLLSGFIQANIAFSSKELTFLDKINPEKKLYEFEYKNFYVLLSIGELSRICLILDKKASDSLRELILNFIDIFEDNYKEEIKKFEEISDLSLLEPVKNLIEQAFETTMLYPLTLSSQIPPNIIENLSLVQKAAYECAKNLLKNDKYFFIAALIDATNKLLGVISNEEIMWNIHQLIRENIITCHNLHTQKEDLKIKKHELQRREDIIQKFMEPKALDDIIFESHEMSVDEANTKINTLMKKGEIAENNAAYQEALNECRTAFNYAKEFNMEMKLDEISQKISELSRLNKKVELNFALEQANKYERKRDYVLALKFLSQAKDMLSTENDKGNHNKDLEKLENRIKKIQSYL